MAKGPWYPPTLPGQRAMYLNVKNKIGAYMAILGLTQAQVDRIVLICDTFITAYDYVEQIKLAGESLVEWRDEIFTGKPTGDPAQPAPGFSPIVLAVGAFIGIVTEFKEWRELIVALPAYTPSIGENLGIVGAEELSAPEGNITPNIQISTETGFVVKASGSMQGFKALRFEYQRVGSTVWNLVAFADKLPTEFTISPATPGQPENGRIRGIFIRDNVPYGNWTPDFPVTIS